MLGQHQRPHAAALAATPRAQPGPLHIHLQHQQHQPACAVAPSQQQQAAAGVLLERAAAVPRTAGPAPEPTSTSCSSSSREWQRGGSSVRRLGSSSTFPVSAHSSGRRRLSAADGLMLASSAAACAGAADSQAHIAAADAVAADAFAVPPHWSAVDDGVDTASNRGSSRTSSRASSSSRSSSSSSGSRQQHQQRSTPQVTGSDWLLMQQIRADCHTCDDVASLFNAKAQQFTAQHSAAALYQLASLWQQLRRQRSPQQAQQFTHASKLQRERQQMQQVGGVLLRALCARMQEAQLRDLADAWYAVDTLDLLQPSSGGSNSSSSSAAAAAHDGAAASSSSSSNRASPAPPPSAAAAAFVAASLQHSRVLLLRQQSVHHHQVQLRHLSRLLTSLAHVGISPSQDWWAAALDAAAGLMEQIQQQQGQQQQQRAVVAKSLSTNNSRRSSSSSESGDVTSHTNAQAVSLVGWAAAELKAPASAAWWRLFHDSSRALMPVMFPNHLSHCLYACAVAQRTPDAAWFTAFYAACRRCWPLTLAQGFSVNLWALAALQQKPPAQWLAELDAASTTALPDYTLQHMGVSLWALARLQGVHKRPAAVAAAAAETPTPSSQSLQQQQRQVEFPSAAWQDRAWVQLSRLTLDSRWLAPQGLACLLWGIVRLQLQLPQARLQELERMCCEVVRHMDGQALAMTVWALGTLRGAATSRQFLKRVHSRCNSEPDLLLQLPPEGLCMLLCGLSRTHAWQPDSFKQALLAAVTARVELPQQQLQQQHESKKQRRKKQQQQQGQGQDGAGVQQASRSNSPVQVFEAGSLPLVLMYLRHLRIAAPPEFLCKVEATLQQQLPTLPLPQLCLGLFALGAARHTADAAFLTAALARVRGEVARCSGLDAAHVLFGLAAMSCWGGSSWEALQSAELQDAQFKLVSRAQQELQALDSRALAMLLWALGRLQLQPSETFLQSAMSATLVLMPSMSLLSVVTILAAFRALQYLPPLQWMVEVCGAARAKVSSDASARVWQQRDCVRRFEETVAWYNQALQQQAGGSLDELDAVGQVQDEQEQQQAAHKQRQRARMLAQNPGSDAMLAAAVGVAAAVAQQWRW